MFANTKPNYPDILGYLTGGDRYSVNPLEFALSTGRSAVWAGEAFNLFILVQNTVDVSVTVTLTVHLPEGFLVRTKNLHILVRPAEVGYLRLPVSVETSVPVNHYKISLEMTTEVNGKPHTVRTVNKDPNLDYYFTFSEESLDHIIKLKPMKFHTGSRNILASTLSASIKVASAKTDTTPPIKGAHWYSLWSLNDHSDVRSLLERYSDDLSKQVLPLLMRERLYKPLHKATMQRFNKAGYKIAPVEAHFLTKLMIHILEAGAGLQTTSHYRGEEIYRLSELLKTGWQTNGLPIILPLWCHNLLSLANTKPDVLEQVIATLSTALYDELLRDAINHGFRLIEAFNRESLGTREEIENYGQQVVNMLWNPQVQLSFVDIYLPLVVGGILINEAVSLPHENVLNELNNLADISIRHTRAEANRDDPAFQLVDSLIGSALRKYGYHR